MELNMSTYAELKEQAAELLRQAEELRAAERGSVVQSVREAVMEWNITINELGLKNGKPVRAKLPAKYRDPASGKEWCGRGAMPRWMSGALAKGYTKDQFAV